MPSGKAWLVAMSTWFIGLSPVSAQTGSGAITGIVKDQAGAAIPGATITVTERRTNLRRVILSTNDGVYTASSLAPGEYRLDVELPGFKSVRREGVHLATGEKARIDFDLSVAEIREQVTIVDDAPIVRGETASLGTVIENAQVLQLPLNGRLFIMLASIVPGVALPPNSVLPRINGGRPRTNEYLFDGISVLQPEPGQVAYYPVIDAIQEFKIESNSPPAEFGRFNGGVVNLTTKSGSNAFHGNVFEFFRNEHLNARNWTTAGISTAARSADRSSKIGHSFLSIIKVSGRPSAAPSRRTCRRSPSVQECSGRTSTIPQRR
jgi:carboxypeptidase family protein